MEVARCPDLKNGKMLLIGIVGVKKTTTGAEGYYIPTNYSGWYVMRDNVPEQQKLSYYTEDIGLNSYYFMSYHDFPWWMNSAEYHMPQNIRGELYMFNHKQLLTRYYLERLSNNMGEVDYVDMTKPIRTGYYPTMHHPKGVPFIQRPVDAEIPLENYHYVQVSSRSIDSLLSTRVKVQSIFRSALQVLFTQISRHLLHVFFGFR